VGSSIEHAFDCDVKCVERAEVLALDEALIANLEKLVNEDLDSSSKHAGSFEAVEQTKEVPLDPVAPEIKVLTVYFGTQNMFITLWFGFDYGTNPPLGTLII
jgi:hypothetical protein